eukprot:9950966-Alexandrium_andersonii.AAC.1
MGSFFAVPGCPKCPITVVAAVGAVACRAGLWWGPPAFLRGAVAALRRAEAWLTIWPASQFPELERRAD